MQKWQHDQLFYMVSMPNNGTTKLAVTWSTVLEKLAVLTSEEIPYILWSLKLHNCVHKRRTCVPIPSSISPVHILSSYFLEVYLNVILLCVPRFSKLSDLVPYQNHVCTSPLPHICHATPTTFFLILSPK